MKKTLNLFIKPIKIMLVLVVFLLSTFNTTLIAQGKIKIRVSINYLKKPDGTKTLIAELKAKEEERYQPVAGVEVHFFYIDKNEEKESLGDIVSDETGKAIIAIANEIFSLNDTSNQYTFIAAVADNKKYTDKEADITIRDVNFKLSTSRFDSIRRITTFVSEVYKQGEKVQYLASEDVEVNVFVKRLFSLLPIGKGRTDSNGEFSFDFPVDLPGDSLGNVTIVSKIIEDDLYGSLDAEEIVNWGIPVQKNHALGERELWSARANAPYYLVALVNVILFGVWGYIFYICYQLIRIYKIGKRPSA